ncbi:MAG: response regulator transcription factor [Bacteroidales bacterium]|nr:response regulator transcription factor [Bacteroidales bacterium]
MIGVHITDDHKILVEGLKVLIDESKNVRVTGVSYTLEECRKALAFQTPEVLLLDLNLPDGSGIDFCSEVRKNYPQVKILILTTHNEYSVARRVMDNGASGYILKNALSEEIITGIEVVAEGESFLCDEIDILMKKRTAQQLWFTAREKELLQLIASGYTNREMADKLFLSEETIKTYRKNLIAKVGAKNTMLLVKMALENKWV